FISLFFMLTDMLPIYKINSKPLQAFVTGLFEVTHGCKMLSQLNLSFTTTAVLAQSIISFGGLCIILQSYAYLKDCGISFLQIISLKTIQASVSCIVTFIVCLIF
ncbi:MAG: hypothetical protein IJV77_02645, partial [Clostridia bacterium]|nr:hypothetical protein [Clostridia bacterium]